jgi:hypothetical protein
MPPTTVKTVDGNVAASTLLTVDASALTATSTLNSDVRLKQMGSTVSWAVRVMTALRAVHSLIR